MLLGIYSCSNNEFEDSFNQESQTNSKPNFASDSVYLISSYEDLFSLFGIEPAILDADNKAPSSSTMLRSLSIETVTGYNSVTNTDLYRAAFNSDVAKILGLYSGKIYHVYMKNLKKIVTIPSGYSLYDNPSPNCGYQPILNNNGEGTNFTFRGYLMQANSSTVTLSTHILYVQNEEFGANIKKDYPCTPAESQWSYILWKN